MKIKITYFTTGLTIGVLAAFAQAFMGIVQPEAYGVCMIGHTRDLVGWISGGFILRSPSSIQFPLLTTVGVIAGAFLSSITRREFKIRHNGKRQALYHLIYGFIVMNLGLILGGCPLRVIIKTAYGDPLGIAGIGGIVFGSLLGVEHLKRS